MTRSIRSAEEIDPGPVQIQARKVHFDISDVPLHWIPGHPVASNVIGLLNLILPAAERWFVATYNEALPLVKDPKLAEDMRGFIGQEVLTPTSTSGCCTSSWRSGASIRRRCWTRWSTSSPRCSAPSTSTNPKRRMNQLCDRLWFIAALEHYTAVIG